MVKGWLDHTLIIHSVSAVSHPCALVQLVLSSPEEQSVLSSKTVPYRSEALSKGSL